MKASKKRVNFEGMTVRIIKANTAQIMDYYPFGLMWEKQSVTSTDNLKWHHGKELQEKSLPLKNQAKIEKSNQGVKIDEKLKRKTRYEQH